MSSWLTRGRPAAPPRRVRPALEFLENRDCPSVGTQPNDVLWYALNSSAPPVITAPVVHPVMSPLGDLGPGGGQSGPQITMSLAYNGRNSVTLSGYVTDSLSSAVGLTVTFSGEVSASTVTGANGYYSITTNAAGLGNITACTMDGLGYASNGAVVTVTSQAPVVSNFNWVAGYNNVYTFTATVTDASPAGLTVTFGGIPSLTGKTATVQSDGTVELSVQLKNDGSDNGNATAQTTNWWGLHSNVALSAVWVSG